MVKENKDVGNDTESELPEEIKFVEIIHRAECYTKTVIQNVEGFPTYYGYVSKIYISPGTDDHVILVWEDGVVSKFHNPNLVDLRTGGIRLRINNQVDKNILRIEPE
jgi:hypothetical protein